VPAIVPYDLNSDTTVVLTPVGESKVTFQVQASTGKTIIHSGQIGGFTIMDDAVGTFTGGKIANSEFGTDNKINGINLS